MMAKYSGKCKTCGKPIYVGDEINWHGTGNGASHKECPKDYVPVLRTPAEIAEIEAKQKAYAEEMIALCEKMMVVVTCEHFQKDGNGLGPYCNTSMGRYTSLKSQEKWDACYWCNKNQQKHFETESAKYAEYLKSKGYQNWGTCSKCGGQLFRTVNSYPPYCDSSYEEFVCSHCGDAYCMSI